MSTVCVNVGVSYLWRLSVSTVCVNADVSCLRQLSVSTNCVNADVNVCVHCLWQLSVRLSVSTVCVNCLWQLPVSTCVLCACVNACVNWCANSRILNLASKRWHGGFSLLFCCTEKEEGYLVYPDLQIERGDSKNTVGHAAT